MPCPIPEVEGFPGVPYISGEAEKNIMGVAMLTSGDISARGNHGLLSRNKIAFFCSRRHPASIERRAYEWAAACRGDQLCILSGSHSRLEREVLRLLLREEQAVILALARGMHARFDPALRDSMAAGRLLVISCFTPVLHRVTRESAFVRNDFMAGLADEIFIAHAHPGGSVEKLFRRWICSRKRVRTFDVPENRELIEAGAVGV
jgi:hypothetical protein